MRASRSILLVTFGCGPSSGDASEGATSSSSSSSPSTSSGSTTTTATDDPSSSGGKSGGEIDSGGSTTADTSSSSTTGAPIGPIAYCADAFVGGYDRTNIWRRDETANVCTLVRLIHHGGGWDGPMLELPQDYAVERIMLTHDAPGCGSDSFGEVPAIAAAGVVEMTGNPLSPHPDAVSIDATVEFDPAEAWIPAQIVLQADQLVLAVDCVSDESAWVAGV